MADEILLTEKRGHITILTLNRPDKMNTLGGGLGAAINDAWAEYMEDDNAWVAIITGAGRSFSAGADIRAAAERYASGGGESAPAPRRRPDVQITKPIIAAVNGFAVAGGLLLALKADMRIAAESATFWMGEVKWSMTTPYKIMLPWYVPLGIAMEMTLVGDRMSAQRAYEVGLVNKVVPDADLMTAALEMADKICMNAPVAVRAHKESILRALEMPFDAAGPMTREIMKQIQDSEDAREGTSAFAEKRSPVWKNR